MATFGKDISIFQKIAGGNLQALRDLVASTTQLVQQPMPSTDFPGNITSQGEGRGPTSSATIERSS